MDEVSATILDAGICEIQGRELDIWVLVPYPLLQRAHGIFRLHCFGTNDIGYLEVQGHVLEARGRSPLDLLIESAVG